MPHGSPRYVPSCALEEWFAVVRVTATSATRAVPPLLIECGLLVVGDALLGEPAAQLDLGDDRAAEPLVECDRVADVIAVAVRDENEVAALGLELVGRARRVAGEPGVDVDARAGRCVEAERGVPEPGQRRCKRRRHLWETRQRWPTTLNSVRRR